MDGVVSFSVVPEILGRFIFLKQVTSYATVSSMALIIWEYLSTLGEEVELVWHSRWSLPKAVYLLNRYISLLMASIYILTVFFGERTPMSGFPGTLLGFLTGTYVWIAPSFVQLVLHLWLYAIYCHSHHRKCLIPISVACAILSCVVLFFTMKTALSIRFLTYNLLCVSIRCTEKKPLQSWHPSEDRLERLIFRKNPLYYLALTMSWTMLTVLLLALVAFKVAYTYRQRDRKYDGLANILVRDSLLYCLVTLVVSIMSILMVVCIPFALYSVGAGHNAAIPNIMANRILINMRAWEKYREDRADVGGVDLDEWETMFYFTG